MIHNKHLVASLCQIFLLERTHSEIHIYETSVKVKHLDHVKNHPPYIKKKRGLQNYSPIKTPSQLYNTISELDYLMMPVYSALASVDAVRNIIS
jgi:hypothetical protein